MTTSFAAGLLAMTFLGFGLGTLVGLVSVGALSVTLLYVLRLRRRPVRVPFAPLFGGSTNQEAPTELRSRLRRLLSWLLHVLLFVLLVFALGDPRTESEIESGRSVVFVVDVSASMAEPAVGAAGTRIDVARERLRSFRAGLGPADRVLVIAAGQRPEPLSTWTDKGAVLEEAIASLRARDTGLDLEAALDLARDALAGRERPLVVVVGDGATSPLVRRSDFPDIQFESVVPGPPPPDSEAPPNVGIASFSVRPYPDEPDRHEMLIEVANTGAETAEVEVQLHGREERALLEVLRLVVPGGERVRRVQPDVPGAVDGLVAELARVDGLPDALSRDNRAFATLLPLRPRRVLVVGQASTFLDAALLLDAASTVTRLEAQSYPPSEPFDLTIFTGAFPPRSSSTGPALYLGVPTGEPSGYPVQLGAPLELFGFDGYDRKSPVFRDVDPYDAQVLTGRALVPARGDQVLGHSAGRPILVRGTRDEGTFIAFGFAPEKSDLVLRIAWPPLVHNLLDSLVPKSIVDGARGLRSGREERLLVGSAKDVRVAGPLAWSSAPSPPTSSPGAAPSRRLAVTGGTAPIVLDQAGFYELTVDGEASRVAVSFFDAEEARHAPSSELRYTSVESGAAEGVRRVPRVAGFEPRARLPLWVWVTLGVFAVSLLEWWTYHRRWTV